ncbi:MAG: hypothetical protein V4606_04790 [Patescibacteria group bacterium]
MNIVVVKTVFSLIVLGLMFLPLWFFLGARSMLNPEGFLQEFFVLGVGIWLVGAAQLMFFIVGMIVQYFIWTD